MLIKRDARAQQKSFFRQYKQYNMNHKPGKKWTVVSFEDGSQESATTVKPKNTIPRNTQQPERFEGVISDSVVVNEMGTNGYLTTWKVTKRPRGRKESSNVGSNQSNLFLERTSQNIENRTTPPPFKEGVKLASRQLKNL